MLKEENHKTISSFGKETISSFVCCYVVSVSDTVIGNHSVSPLH